MKNNRIIGNILFLLALFSPLISFAVVTEIGEVDIFSTAGMVRYSWVMWFFIPIGVLSLIFGKHLKINGEKYKKNYISGFFCIFLLVIFGSYRFIFNNISYDISKMDTIEEKIKLDLPNNVKIATSNYNQYSISYAKIIDEEEKAKFEIEVKNSELWRSELDSKIKGILPYNIQFEIDNFDYFAFYNVTNEEYNYYPSEGKYECVFIACDFEAQRIIILDEYTICLIDG